MYHNLTTRGYTLPYSYFETKQPQPQLAVSLIEYTQMVGVNECAFWGVNPNLDESAAGTCAEVWSAEQRQTLSDALATAQTMMETPLRYSLIPRWITGTINSQPPLYTDEDFTWVDSQPFLPKISTKWGRVLGPGVQKLTAVALDLPLDRTSDPHFFELDDSVLAGITFSDDTTLVITYPDSLRRIVPSYQAYNGAGGIRIEIPRCRTVKEELIQNPTHGYDYEDLDNFIESVDVVLEERDLSTQAQIVSNHNCTDSCSDTGCAEYIQTACIYVDNARTGRIRIVPSNYADGVWTKTSYAYANQEVRLNYRAGMVHVPANLKTAIVRLAHTVMAEEPCSCSPVTALWEKDRAIPPFITPQRDQCPFGLMDGAWWCWKQLQTSTLHKVSVI